MQVIGIDCHKDTHTAVSLDEDTAKLLDHITVAARYDGHQDRS